MARGSEQISRKWLEGVTHFTRCGEMIRRLADVGEVRTVFNPKKREVYCMAHRGGRK